MDIISLVFYAIVCGLLGLSSPALSSPAVRLGVGAVVGIVASFILPMIRGAVGY